MTEKSKIDSLLARLRPYTGEFRRLGATAQADGEIDDKLVREYLKANLDDFDRFAQAVRRAVRQ